MSFFSDPTLFLMSADRIYIVTVPTKPGCLIEGEVGKYEELNFSKHLSLPHNEESDFLSLFAYLSENNKLVNCQGIVINWFLNDNVFELSWSPEEINLSSYGIHALVSHLENETDARKIERLERERDDEQLACMSTVSELLTEQHQERLAYERQILDLTSKLEKCCDCGAKGGSVDEEEHWMTGHAVPSNLVPFEGLDVLCTFPRNTPLTITKATPTTRVIGEDKSTNVKVSRFCRVVYPIVIVKVDELVPDKENARFDPDIWGLFQYKGTSYAARKPFESEML